MRTTIVPFLSITAACLTIAIASCEARDVAFRLGAERLAESGFSELLGKRVGIITNHSGVDRSMRSLVDLLAAAENVDLVAIFSPEHGFRGSAQAGEKVADSRDARTGVIVHSLYGATRRPTPAMLDAVDVLLFDIQDIGVRAYTYLSTLVEALEAAAERRRPEVWVLDRPNPLGAATEGPVLESELRSFVGAHPVPLRHGLTAGEFAKLVVAERGLDVELRVVAMDGYRQGDAPRELVWVAPSPNIPTRVAALAYAGTVLVEGTNLSEGRGTTRPFQLIGAPWIDAPALVAALRAEALPGVLFREASFTPVFSKHEGEDCAGIEIHITDAIEYRAFATALAIIAHVRHLHPEAFAFRAETFDKLAGTKKLREALEAGRDARTIEREHEAALAAFRERSAKYRLYR